MTQLPSEAAYFLSSLALCVTLPALQYSILSRRAFAAQNLPWYEKARLLWPAREYFTANLLFLPILCGILPIAARRAFLINPFFIWLGCCVAVLGCLSIWRLQTPFPNLTLREALKRMRGDILIGGHLLYILTIAMACLGQNQWTRWSTIQAALFIAIFLAFHLGGTFSVLKMTGTAQPASEEIYQMTFDLADQSGIRRPNVIVVSTSGAGAWAILRPKSVLFSDRLIANVSREHLTAICRHEIAHLTESPTVGFARMLLQLPFFVVIAMIQPVIGTLGFDPWSLFLGVSFAATLSFRKLYKKMEERADAIASYDGQNKGEYAQALARMYELNLVPAVLRRAQSYPHLYDRMTSAGLTPSYARPEPPTRSKLAIIMYLAGLLIASAVTMSLLLNQHQEEDDVVQVSAAHLN